MTTQAPEQSSEDDVTARVPDAERHRCMLIKAARSRRPVFVSTCSRGIAGCVQGFVGAVHETAAVLVLNQTSESIVKLSNIREVVIQYQPHGGRRGGRDRAENGQSKGAKSDE